MWSMKEKGCSKKEFKAYQDAEKENCTILKRNNIAPADENPWCTVNRGYQGGIAGCFNEAQKTSRWLYRPGQFHTFEGLVSMDLVPSEYSYRVPSSPFVIRRGAGGVVNLGFCEALLESE